MRGLNSHYVTARVLNFLLSLAIRNLWDDRAVNVYKIITFIRDC